MAQIELIQAIDQASQTLEIAVDPTNHAEELTNSLERLQKRPPVYIWYQDDWRARSEYDLQKAGISSPQLLNLNNKDTWSAVLVWFVHGNNSEGRYGHRTQVPHVISLIANNPRTSEPKPSDSWLQIREVMIGKVEQAQTEFIPYQSQVYRPSWNIAPTARLIVAKTVLLKAVATS
jgi:hypothetical protein